MNFIENRILSSQFGGLPFCDEREQNVFLEYIRSFSFLFYSQDIASILEIGAGHSTLIFSLLAKRTGCRVTTIDKNPEALLRKIKNQTLIDEVFGNVNFEKEVSVSCDDFLSYYESTIQSIGGVNVNEVIENSGMYIELEMDNRKERDVINALGINKLAQAELKDVLISDGKFSDKLLKIFRTRDDEFEHCCRASNSKGVLSAILDRENIDVVFLDSGEFVSIVEWEIVSKKLKKGAYVLLHDIYFPKSFKNWLVCASISASPKWDVLYQDKSTPQGMLLARKSR